MIPIRNKKELETLREAGRCVAMSLEKAINYAKEGVSLLELDSIIEDNIRSLGAKPSFKGLYGFPNSACLSLNEVVIHGVPNEYKLQNGDILGIDIGSFFKNYYGDGAVTIPIGIPNAVDQKLIECSNYALESVIEEIKIGMYFKEISRMLQECITSFGFTPLLNFCGHGIGTKPHCEPEIPNYLSPNIKISGPKVKEGMVFCLEPMVCQKSGDPIILNDKWSVVSKDGLRTSHHEHQVAIIGGKAEILTQR